MKERLTAWDGEHAYIKKCFEGNGCEGNASADDAKCISCEHYAAVFDRLAAYEDAEEQSCDACQYKVNSEAWLYYTYPCNECKRRTKDHFTKAAMREGVE